MSILKMKSEVRSAQDVLTAVHDQYIKMRSLYGHSVEDDVDCNSDGQLLYGAQAIMAEPETSWSIEERLDWLKHRAPGWNKIWLTRKMESTYKDRLKVGISLLIAELERVMYLENQRIKSNDSSTTSNTGNPESDRTAECAGAE